MWRQGSGEEVWDVEQMEGGRGVGNVRRSVKIKNKIKFTKGKNKTKQKRNG